ncbi:MAG: nuclear transport factor 2 family protein [Actinobacteria bacterium]|nr:nuclear transport factor 2 family protein [Actinomycetota bacterium]MBW3650107.1 nuclear transport factor 2 family protein [Actinomycetota bacterium]
MAQSDFDGAVEAFRQALHAYLKGDPQPVTQLFSRREDVTLANPLGPPRRGPAQVDKGIEEGASYLRDGSVRDIEEVSRYTAPEIGYVVQLERGQARLSGSDEMVPLALRVTMIFRREEDTWKVTHRHADPITTARPITTVIETGSSIDSRTTV